MAKAILIKNGFTYFFRCLLLTLLLRPVSGTAQMGNYFIKNYSSDIYNGHANNLDIIQDSFGLLYFANNTGLLEYNGKNWVNIHVTEGSKTPYSVARASNGRIYVGSENELGYLDRSKKGQTVYVSLLNLLKKDERDFNQVWNTLIIHDTVYFCANELIIRYVNGAIKTFRPKVSFHKAQLVNGILFVREVETGLMYLRGDELIKIESSELFAPADFKIAFYLPAGAPNQYYIFTRKKGVFRFELNLKAIRESKISKLNNKEFDLFKDAEPYDGLSIDNGNIVIGTLNKGLFIFDRSFKLLQSVNTINGAINDECKRLYIDNQKNLWVAFNNGISKIEISSPLKKLDQFNLIRGLIERITKYNDRYYLATTKGLWEYNEADGNFYIVQDVTERCLDVQVVDDLLYFSTESGLYYFNGKTIGAIEMEGLVSRIAYSEMYPHLIFCGTENGISVVNAADKKLLKEIESPLEKSDVKNIAFFTDNKILASTRSEGMFALDINNFKTTVIPQNGFYQRSSENYILNYKYNVYMGSDSGLYMIDNSLRFNPVTEVNSFLKSKYLVDKFAFYDKDLFLFLTTKGGDYKQLCYSFEKKQEDYAPLNKISGSHIKNYFFDEAFVFICSDNAVFLLDKNNPGITRKPQPYISKVIYNNDTILYNVETEKSLKLEFNQNKFVFEFGSNDFSEESQLEFHYFLEGYQNGFSEWTTNYKAAFDNVKLSEGEYTFHLRARNCYGQVSDDLLFRFEILPPWYRTRLAYILYIIAGIGIILLIIKLNSQRLIALNKKLERTIEERTQTITQQKAEIEHKNQEITDSINYAQKIQIALMASMRLLDKNLKTGGASVSPKDYFLLYNPKDIVSGDFYWATELTISGEKYFLVVIADCTGHGVPGAFMSLLCIGFLNEITREKQIVDPGKIFDELRSRIILTLNPDGSETERKDGMDAVLLGFNASSNTLSYAAANNSFYVIRNNELMVLKADKMPVGKYSEEVAKSFSTQQLALQKGDVVYAFTDGYADQFGGPKGKKFKYKQLEEVLLEIHKMDAATQRQILNTRFLDWKNSQEQVDDVLVIGIQL